MSDTLQWSGVENVWLYDDGDVDLFGKEVHEDFDEITGKIVGIRLEPDYALALMKFLMIHEDKLLAKSQQHTEGWNCPLCGGGDCILGESL